MKRFVFRFNIALYRSIDRIIIEGTSSGNRRGTRMTKGKTRTSKILGEERIGVARNERCERGTNACDQRVFGTTAEGSITVTILHFTRSAVYRYTSPPPLSRTTGCTPRRTIRHPSSVKTLCCAPGKAFREKSVHGSDLYWNSRSLISSVMAEKNCGIY